LIVVDALAERAQLPRLFSRGALALVLGIYTLYTLGPFLWLATMSLRTTAEISTDHYAFPKVFHWEQFRIAWVDSDFATYFWNSTIVVVSAVAVVTLFGAAAAHALARYRFSGNRLIYGILFSSIIFPPQITLISLYQILVDYGLYNSLVGLTLVYVSLQLPLTV
jgi:ABC-type glycerol-3-phosphate transport system permease component